MPSLVSIKTVLRCRDFEASRRFYHAVLHLRILEEWNERLGQGAIFGFGPDQRGSLEIYQMSQADPRYDCAFTLQVANDKIDIQLQTNTLHSWVERLKDSWPFTGPEDLPWGQRWITLRDPDGLLIAIYEDHRISHDSTAYDPNLSKQVTCATGDHDAVARAGSAAERLESHVQAKPVNSPKFLGGV